MTKLEKELNYISGMFVKKKHLKAEGQRSTFRVELDIFQLRLEL